MRRLQLLLFIFGLGQVIHAASVFQFPDFTRRLPERPATPGCSYKGELYEHGERVSTPQPCLNCTCIRAVLICYLRVCPMTPAPPSGCFVAREIGECCPTLVCGGIDLSRPKDTSDSVPDLRPTFQPHQKETTDDSSSTADDNEPGSLPPSYDINIENALSLDAAFNNTSPTTEENTNDTISAVENSTAVIKNIETSSTTVSPIVETSTTTVISSVTTVIPTVNTNTITVIPTTEDNTNYTTTYIESITTVIPTMETSSPSIIPTLKISTTTAIPKIEYPAIENSTTIIPNAETSSATVSSTVEISTTTIIPKIEGNDNTNDTGSVIGSSTTVIPTMETSSPTVSPAVETSTTTIIPTLKISTTTAIPTIEHPAIENSATIIPTTETSSTTASPTVETSTTTIISTIEDKTNDTSPVIESNTTVILTMETSSSTVSSTVETSTTTIIPTIEDNTNDTSSGIGSSTTVIPTMETSSSTVSPTVETSTTTIIPTLKDSTTTVVPIIEYQAIEGNTTIIPTTETSSATVSSTAETSTTTIIPTIEDNTNDTSPVIKSNTTVIPTIEDNTNDTSPVIEIHTTVIPTMETSSPTVSPFGETSNAAIIATTEDNTNYTISAIESIITVFPTVKTSVTTAIPTAEDNTNNTSEDIEISKEVILTMKTSIAAVSSIAKNNATNVIPTIKISTTTAIPPVRTNTTKIIPTVNSSITTVTSTVENSRDDIIPAELIGSYFDTTLSDDDSLMYISSTPEPTEDYESNMFNDIPGGCMVNGTLYGDGSAMLSSSFCEYCFCIRGKTTCLKPKCHLDIDGCEPFYDTHYSCCPSRYDCSKKAYTSLNATIETTAASPTPLPETIPYTGECNVDGAVYSEGEVIPYRLACHNCYCSDSNVVCDKIKCSPPLEGCQPIIPAGYCCAISYRCDYQNGNAGFGNIKSSTSNDSALSLGGKGMDNKVKNYFTASADRIKAIVNDGEYRALLHNVIPVHRRLDENAYFEDNETQKDIGALPVFIGHEFSSTENGKEIETTTISEQNRENDKTLSLELNDTLVTFYGLDNDEILTKNLFQTSHPIIISPEKISRTENVSVGPPEVHTLSIQELINKFFSIYHKSTPPIPGIIDVEPKRNNSKQPTSIVEIYDSETHTPFSLNFSDITELDEASETIKDLSIIADIINLEESNPEVLNNVNDSASNYTAEQASTVIDFANHNADDNFNKRIQLPNTKTTNNEAIEILIDSETTFPNLGEFFKQTNKHASISAASNSKIFTDQDFLKASSTPQIFTSTGHLYSDKFTGHTEFHSPIHPNTKNTYNDPFKQADITTPGYTSTGNVNTGKLETQPTISNYDFTKYSYNGVPKVTTETYPTTLSFDSTKKLYSDEFPKKTETHSTFTAHTSNGNLYGEESKKTTKIPPLYPIFINTKEANNKGKIKAPSPTPLYETTRNEFSEVLKNENVPQNVYATYKDLEDGEMQTKILPIVLPVTTTENANTEASLKEKETHSTFSITTPTKKINNSKTSAIVDQIPTTKTLNIGGFKEKVTFQPTTAVFLADNTDDTLTTLDGHTTDVSTEKHIETTQNVKTSRINSKLPSFSYIENNNENNNTFSSRFPVLTDSVVNVYLPAEGRDTNDDKKKDFTNVGSIYIGAPLSVGTTDTRKDLEDHKPKITHSGGVIYMDPKYTDIDTKTLFEAREKNLRNPVSATSQPLSTSMEKSEQDITNNERKKGPRIQDTYNQSSTGQGFKVIPFVAEDAIRNKFGKLNNTFLVQQGSTEGLPDMVSDFCFVKGRIYMNGEMIGKPDPCELCRCFYGRELCQIQKCPAPPDCVPEKVPGFCCPRFTCGNNATSSEQQNRETKPTAHVQLAEIETSTTRKPHIEEKPNANNNRQEVKYGIRVRPTQSATSVSKEQTTEMKVESEKTTTVKPATLTVSHTTTTTSKKPSIIRTITNQKADAKKTTQRPLIPDPWGLLKVSGCNIYGKYFNINDQVEILSGPCSHCICTTNGVECNDIC